MINTVRVNADRVRDFHLLVDHMTKLRNFTKGENRDFLAFKFSLHLMLEQTLSNVIVCLMISQKNYIQKLHKRDSRLEWILGRFIFFAKFIKRNRFDEAPLNIV